MEHKTKHNNLKRAAFALLVILMTCASAWAQGYDYIDANGGMHNTADDGISVTVLTGNEPHQDHYGDVVPLAAGWYYVGSDISYDCALMIEGNVTIILGNGCTLHMANNDYGVFNPEYSYYTLTIYGQSLDKDVAGTIYSYSTNSTAFGVYNYIQHSGNVNIARCHEGISGFGQYACCETRLNGGTLNINAVAVASNDQFAIGIEATDITINGGQLNVTATGGSWPKGIYSKGGTISLGWTNPTDFICVNSYSLLNNVLFHSNMVAADTLVVFGTDTEIIGEHNEGLNGLTLVPPCSTGIPGISLEGDMLVINNDSGWNLFCDFLQFNDIYNRFSGRTVKLGADFSVTRMMGSSGHEFCGTFDGNHKTLTFNSTDNVGYVAPFRYVSSTTPFGATEISPAAIHDLNVVCNITTGSEVASGLVGQVWGDLDISGCTVSGTITTSSKYACGFIGEQDASTTNMTNCRSSITINSSVNGDGTHCGFVGKTQSGTTANISGCLFNGRLLGGTTNSCAGFVGWSNGTTNISNSIFNPTEVTISTDNCATFARNRVNVDHSYYYQTLGSEQGKLSLSINAGEYVSVVNASTPTVYDVSGITSYDNGFLYNNMLYAGENEVLSLTLGHSDREGYLFNGYLATAGTFSGNENPYTLTMPNNNVTINSHWDVAYVAADGSIQGCADYTVLTSDMDVSNLSDGWYVADNDLSYNHIAFSGNANLILFDGVELSVNSNNQSNAINAHDLTIYGQSYGTGKLTATSPSGYNGIYIDANDLTIYNCDINASGITALKNVNINGGRINVNGGFGLASMGGIITLGWHNASDCITANNYFGTVCVAPGQAFTDGTNAYVGTLTSEQVAAIANATLVPCATRTISGYGDENGHWAFIASPVVGNLDIDAVANLKAEPAENYDLYRLNPSTVVWENYKNTVYTDFNNLINGHGYLYANKNDVFLAFPGAVNTENTETVNLGEGWNLVGNPFPTAAYIDRAYYKMNDEGSDVEPVLMNTNEAIPACTGVVVHADSEEETATFVNTTQRFFGEGGLLMRLSMNTTDGAKAQDRGYVSFREGLQLRKFIFNEEHAKLFMTRDNEDYAIAYSQKTGEIPLRFKAVYNGEYTLTVNPIFVEMENLHLVDNQTGAEIDLLSTPTYSFTANAGDDDSRFKLVFAANSIFENGDNNNVPFAYVSNGNIVVTHDGADATLQIVDVMGRVVVSLVGDAMDRISTNGMPAGVYVLRLVDGNIVRTQKMVIQ